MFISTLLRSRFILIAALALVLATAAYGFAAANTFTNTTQALGDGSQAITGYVVGGVNYTLDAAADPATISAVEFTLTGSPVAKYATVQLVATTGDAYDCVVTGSSSPATATCTLTTPINASTVNTMHVVASSEPFAP